MFYIIIIIIVVFLITGFNSVFGSRLFLHLFVCLSVVSVLLCVLFVCMPVLFCLSVWLSCSVFCLIVFVCLSVLFSLSSWLSVSVYVRLSGLFCLVQVVMSELFCMSVCLFRSVCPTVRPWVSRSVLPPSSRSFIRSFHKLINFETVFWLDNDLTTAQKCAQKSNYNRSMVTFEPLAPFPMVARHLMHLPHPVIMMGTVKRPISLGPWLYPTGLCVQS